MAKVVTQHAIHWLLSFPLSSSYMHWILLIFAFLIAFLLSFARICIGFCSYLYWIWLIFELHFAHICNAILIAFALGFPHICTAFCSYLQCTFDCICIEFCSYFHWLFFLNEDNDNGIQEEVTYFCLFIFVPNDVDDVCSSIPRFLFSLHYILLMRTAFVCVFVCMKRNLFRFVRIYLF